MTEERRQGGWHVSKSISVWHIVGTLGIAVGFFAYLSNIEKETVINQMDIRSLSSRLERGDARTGEQFSEIKTMLEKISDRLDKIADRRDR